MPAPSVSVKKMVWLHEQKAKEQVFTPMNILLSKGTAITGLPQCSAKNKIQFASFRASKILPWNTDFFTLQLLYLCVIEQNNCSSFPLQHYIPVIILTSNKKVEYRLQYFLLT